MTYDYDVTGNVTAIRETGVSSGMGVLAAYGYDDLGRRTSLTRGNGTVTTYTPDAVSRLSSLTQNMAGTAKDLTLGFSYNPASQITGVTRSNGSYAWTGAVTVNRAYTINGLNQTTAAGATALGYDARGNLTSSGTTAYAYSSENLLQSSGANTLAYDPLLRLYQINNTARFGYDGQDLIGEWSTAGVLQKRYVHGPGSDEPVIWYEGSGTSDRRWLHTDERGSVIAVSDASGAVTATNSYDEYGIPGAGNVGRFQYTGQTWLPELGLYYYKARMYSATLGRFMQTDPIGYADGMNWYNYVGGDPINAVDPSGRQTADCHWVDDICSPGPPGGGGGTGRGSGGSGSGSFGGGGATGSGWDDDIIITAHRSPSQSGGAVPSTNSGRDFLLSLVRLDYYYATGSMPPFAARAAYGPEAESLVAAKPKPGSSALKTDRYHNIPTYIKNIAAVYGQHFHNKGNDGRRYVLTQINGSMIDGRGSIRRGVFEFIVNDDGMLTHERFVPDVGITGMPNAR